jgi:hypothetical protein
MALVYHTARVYVESEDIVVRAIEEEDFQIAITFQNSDPDGDEDDVTEVLLTREEVKLAYDLLFNRTKTSQYSVAIP